MKKEQFMEFNKTHSTTKKLADMLLEFNSFSAVEGLSDQLSAGFMWLEDEAAKENAPGYVNVLRNVLLHTIDNLIHKFVDEQMNKANRIQFLNLLSAFSKENGLEEDKIKPWYKCQDKRELMAMHEAERLTQAIETIKEMAAYDL